MPRNSQKRINNKPDYNPATHIYDNEGDLGNPAPPETAYGEDYFQPTPASPGMDKEIGMILNSEGTPCIYFKPKAFNLAFHPDSPVDCPDAIIFWRKEKPLAN